MQRDDGSLWIADRHAQPLTAAHIPQGDSNDCGPHVVTMAVNFWHGEQRLNVEDVTRDMNRPRLRARLPLLIVRRIPNWATFPWGITGVLREHGIPARWHLRAREDDIHAALREDRIAMPIFGEPLRRQGRKWNGWSHVAILAGWNPDSETYWFVDSSWRTTPNQRPRDEFLRLWDNMNRILIEAG